MPMKEMHMPLSPARIFFALSIAMLATLARAAGDVDPDVIGGPPNPAKTEKVTYLGVTAKSVDATLRAQLNLADDTGLTVTTVDHKGPAGADVHVNDVLQKLDDQILIDPHQLVTLIHLHKPGDTVTLTLIREAKPIQISIKLGEKQRTVPPANDPDRTADLNNVNPSDTVPDDQHPAFDPHVPLGPGNQVAMTFSDGTYSANVKADTQGRRHIIVKDLTGQVIAQGPVDTEEEWQKLSPDVRQHLEIMHKALGLKSK
jgi:hypothetical protein